MFTYRVAVDPATGVAPSQLRAAVRAILCDPRGWTASGRVRFREDPRGRFLISLRTAAATERRCTRLLGRPTGSYFSCAGEIEAVLNGARWAGGSRSWPGSVAQYRRLVVNHEVGHLLGMGHRGCPRPGAPAPAMMQQSKGLHGCVANPWPTPAERRALPFGR